MLDAMEANEVQIRELEEDIKTLTQRTVERETELERSDFFLFSPRLFSCCFSFIMVLCKCLLLTKSVCAG